MKLTTITFTGIDEKTNFAELEEIQEEYPFVEWGILLSYHHGENGNRYPDPSILDDAEYRGLNLSAHICGTMALDVLDCNEKKMYETLNYSFGMFRRCQLNINAVSHFRELRTMRPFSPTLDEVIIQMSSTTALDSFMRFVETPTRRVSYLLDGSGGRGIETRLEVYNKPDVYIGYAGGFSPDNVEGKLRTLLNHPTDGKFWIDMESGVRTDDWLDLDKVRKVLRICRPHLNHENMAETPNIC